MTTNDTSTFTYDALGNLAEASWGDQYLYDENGKMLAGSHSQAAAYFAHIPLSGGAIAGYGNGILTEYKHGDWLGSMRFSSTPTRGLNYDVAFAPFGEPYAPPRAGNIFAGMEQIVAADEYETANREYNTTQGRWITPDPAGLAAADPTNPQSWNRYAYVTNNPVSFTDPSGLFAPGLCPVQGLPVCQPGYYNGTSYLMYFTANWNQFDNLENPNSWIPVRAQGCNGDCGNYLIGFVYMPAGGSGPVRTTIGPAPPPIGPTPSQPPPLKPGCTGPALWAGLKAAGQDLIPVPPQFNPDPVGATGDFITSKQGQAATIGVLYEVANGARFLAPFADAAADFVPVVGWAWAGYQGVHALYEGGKAYKESIDECYGGG